MGHDQFISLLIIEIILMALFAFTWKKTLFWGYAALGFLFFNLILLAFLILGI